MARNSVRCDLFHACSNASTLIWRPVKFRRQEMGCGHGFHIIWEFMRLFGPDFAEMVSFVFLHQWQVRKAKRTTYQTESCKPHAQGVMRKNLS